MFNLFACHPTGLRVSLTFHPGHFMLSLVYSRKEHGVSDAALQALIDDEQAMRKLIGRRVRYMDEDYEVTDLVLDEDLIILSADEGTDVQEDSYGRAHRLVPRQQSLRFRDAEGKPTHIWEDVSFLDGQGISE